MKAKSKVLYLNVIVGIVGTLSLILGVLKQDSNYIEKLKQRIITEQTKMYKDYYGVDLSKNWAILKDRLAQIEFVKLHLNIQPPIRDKGRLNSLYGYRKNPVQKDIGGDIGFHEGVDISAVQGTPVFASESGYVEVNRFYYKTGNTIRIFHGFVSTGYCHLLKSLVSINTWVTQGELIGYVGHTGKYQTGSHLHFFVFNTETRRFDNPLLYVRTNSN